jgi:hypothetical protein
MRSTHINNNRRVDFDSSKTMRNNCKHFTIFFGQKSSLHIVLLIKAQLKIHF